MGLKYRDQLQEWAWAGGKTMWNSRLVE